MNSHQLQQSARLITAVMIAFCMTQTGLAQSIFLVGVPVCDTIQTGLIAHSNTPGGCDYPEDYFEFVRGPYVTGLSFQMIITETSGRVWSDLSDSLKAGDVFTIPDVSAIPDTLRSGLRIHFRVYSSFGFVTRIVGTPTVAYESYYSILDASQTTSMCRNIYLYSAKRGQILQVQPPQQLEKETMAQFPRAFNCCKIIPTHSTLPPTSNLICHVRPK